jgi:uracil-DNA glycosylase
MANACEALQSIPNQKLTLTLGQLFQDAYMPTKETKLSNTDDIEAVLDSLVSRRDPWLQECAKAARNSLRRNDNG